MLLAGVIGVVLQTHTFEVLGYGGHLPPDLQRWLFAAFALAFLIKTPVFPLHAWMPPTYTQSPPSLVAMVSGVQSKAGLYAFIVFALPLFPDAAHYFAPAMLVLAVCSILYGALLAIAERNAKTLVAYSSLSHLGLVLLALFAFNFTSLPASILMIVSHGTIAAALFLLVGFIEDRTGTNDLGAFGGLAAGAPAPRRVHVDRRDGRARPSRPVGLRRRVLDPDRRVADAARVQLARPDRRRAVRGLRAAFVPRCDARPAAPAGRCRADRRSSPARVLAGRAAAGGDLLPRRMAGVA